MPKRNYTNILATLGPSSDTREVLEKMVDAGANAFRFNFSHGTHQEHRERYNVVRKIEKEKKTHIAVVADLQGPKLRVGKFKEDRVFLHPGQSFVLDLDPKLGDENRVCLPHTEIFEAIKPGDKLLLNDGNITLEVKSCDAKHAVTEVIYGGYLSGHKGVNLPNTQLNISAITPKDEEDLKFALKLGVDWVCLSFVQSANDIREAKKLIGDQAWIISKLEKPSAMDDLEEIIKLSDGIMVARGDLGVECPIQTVPVLQKRIVTACRRHGKPVIVATQMLESMIQAPTPTRAEVSDIATAVYDGVDTVMLSAETAAGQYPVESVAMMQKIVAEVESDPLFFSSLKKGDNKICCADQADSITFAASVISSLLQGVSAIVSFTTSGSTALLTARERPKHPIMAVTPDVKVARRMAIVWGIRSFINNVPFKSFEKAEQTAVKLAKDNGFAKSGDHLILTAGYPLNQKGTTNLLHTVHIK